MDMTNNTRPKKSKSIDQILKSKRPGIKLDLGCGACKQGKDWIGMDIRQEPGVDIVHNLEQFPYPLPDNSCSMVLASHVLEHMTPNSVDPRLAGLIDLLIEKKVLSAKDVYNKVGRHHVFGIFMTMMDEIWRILEVGGQFAFVVPYAGSPGFFQDPTHVNNINEATPFYFDPEHQSGLWRIYKSKPWKIEVNIWNANGVLEVVMSKRDDKNYGTN